MLTDAISTIIEPKICIICVNNQADLPETFTRIQTAQISPQTNIAEPIKFTRLPVGLNIGKNPVIASTFVRGAEDGKEAVDFDNWLISFKDIQTALNLNVKTLEDGQLEIRSPGLITRINPKELKTDPELGLVLSIAEIKNKLGVKCEFNIIDYAVVFNPPWLNLETENSEQKILPVILEGLPKITPPTFTLTAVGQQINLTSKSTSASTESQSDLTAVGSLLGGSVTLKIKQSDLTDASSWQLNEFQYLRQTPTADYAVGYQPTFWQTQGSGSYWGFTTIQRFGFTPTDALAGGFSPSQRLQPGEITRTITGEAKPGTLVQLKQGTSGILVREVLVDSSGVYRFDNISMGRNKSNDYRIFFYPNGQLTAQPIIQEAKFSNLAARLSKGTSALIISTGLSQQLLPNNFIGKFQDLRGGVAYRLGLTENLTLGAGVIYDQSLLGLGELFYQPEKLPLRINAAFLMGTKSKGWDYNANISLNPSPRLNLNFFSDRLAQRFEVNWQVLSGMGLKFSSNSREDSLTAGINLSQIGRNFSIFSSADINNKNKLNWNLSSTLANFQLSHRGNDIGTNTELNYKFSPSSSSGNSLKVIYETSNTDSYDYLTSFKWNYVSKNLFKDYKPQIEFDLGYGMGSRGNGIIASASTAMIPGLILTVRYQEVSITNNETSFKIELSPSINLQPQLGLGDSRFDSLRSGGGIFIQPFLDQNANGKLDNNEKIYTQDADLLLIINNKSLKFFQADWTADGIFVKLPAGTYRLDLDPAGYPMNRQPIESAYAVEVIAGSYSTVRVPMIVSYTVAGRLIMSGNPIAGAKVEAIPSQSSKSKKTIVSITNSAGIYFLEELQPGTYNLLVNGQPAQPHTIEINQSSNQLQEINLVINQ
jgi:hypothetical protein